jgi:hypothetical protein
MMGTGSFNFYSAAAAGSMKAAPFVSGVSPASRVTPPAASGELSLSKVLKDSLFATLNNRLTWKHQQLNTPDRKVRDTFVAETYDYKIEISGFRPPIHRDSIPTELINWKVSVEWRRHQAAQHNKTKVPAKIIDGNVIVLPTTVTEQTDPNENIIGKLFRVVYEKVAGAFSKFVPLIKNITEKLKKKDITYSYSRVQGDYTLGLQNAKVIQVGETAPKVVLSSYGLGGIQLTVVGDDNKSIRLGAQQLQNPALKEVINNLVKEVNRQRLGKDDMGLESF